MFPWKDDAPRTLAGLMSGTSADGMDVAIAEISGRGRDASASLLAHETIPYSPQARSFIHRCMDPLHVPCGYHALGPLSRGSISACRAAPPKPDWTGLQGRRISGQTLHHPQTEVITGLKVRGSLQAEAAVCSANAWESPWCMTSGRGTWRRVARARP